MIRAWHGLIVLILAFCAIEANAAPQVGGGEGYSCALGAGGRAFCWGTNTSGQTGSGIGLPFQLSVSRPTEMAGGFITVASGAFHSCGLQADGSAFCWGDNYFGQLGIGTSAHTPGNTRTTENLPVRVQSPIAFKSISVGGVHTCAIDVNDQAWCWGSNSSSQLGQHKQFLLTATTPVTVSANSQGTILRFKSISAGTEHTCAIDLSDAAWCWGSNVGARAGIDVNFCGGAINISCEFHRPVLTVASGGAFNLRFSTISAGWLNTCGIDTGGAVQCWGQFFRGSPLTGSPDRPAQVGSVSNSGPAVSVSAGGSSVCAVSSTGELFCWGKHDQGQLGNAAAVAPGASSVTPVLVAGTLDYTSVSVGFEHACARTITGTARCWGRNDRGQLGISGMGGTQVNVPMLVVGLESSLVSTGRSHVCSLDPVGVVACWGDNADGQIGHGRTGTAPSISVVPTPVARFYQPPRSSPFPPPSVMPEELSNTMPPIKFGIGTMEFTRLSVGGQHACALNSAGIAYCWGADSVGQIGSGKRTTIDCRYGKEPTGLLCVPSPTIVSRGDAHFFADISAGGAHSCARNNSGIVYCWGSAQYNELGSTTTPCTNISCFQRVPTQIEVPFPYRPQMLDVSAGQASTCAVNGSDVFCWGAAISKSLTPEPMKYPSGPNYLHVGAGASSACAQVPNLTMLCIGNNTFGQLGDGTNTSAWTATMVTTGSMFAQFSLSWGHTCGADPFAGEVLCWGTNYSGQLGDGTTLESNVPVKTLLSSGFAPEWVGTGFDHTCAMNKSGNVQCWGSNAFGQLGDGLTGAKAVAVPVTLAAGWSLP